MTLEIKKLYFRNLDGLRFIAAFLVLLFHCGRLDQVLDGKLTMYTQFFRRGSGLGVDLFFAISGFLITFLLISEVSEKNKINIKKFYLKRVLRIWPLYFGVGIIGIVFGPMILNKLSAITETVTTGQTITNLIFLFLFSINWQVIFGLFNAGGIGTFWSVSIEEQFYLIWAPILNFCKTKIFSVLLITTFVGLISLVALKPEVAYYSTLARFFNFGLGALLAYIIFNVKNVYEAPIFKVLLNKYLQWALILFSIFYTVSIGTNFIGTKGEFFVNAFLSTYWVLNGINPKSILNFENKILKHLGKISYGIYVFHLFCIQFCVKLYTYSHLNNNPISYYLFWLFPLSVVVLIATISYEFYEKPFLKIKNKF